MSDKSWRRMQTAFRDAEKSKTRLSGKRALDREVDDHVSDWESPETLGNEDIESQSPVLQSLQPKAFG